MKKLIFAGAFLLGTFAMAQQTTTLQKKDPAQMQQMRENKLKMMQSELNLTPAQVAQIKALHDKQKAEIKPSIQADRKANMEQMKAKREQWNAEMRQILTPEQYQKWQEKKRDKMERKGKMMPNTKMQRQDMKQMPKTD